MTLSGIPGVTADAPKYVQKALLPDRTDAEAVAELTRSVVLAAASIIIIIIQWRWRVSGSRQIFGKRVGKARGAAARRGKVGVAFFWQPSPFPTARGSGSTVSSPDPLTGGEEAGCLLTKNPTSATGVGFLWRGSHSLPARGSGKCCKLPQWVSGQNLGRKSILHAQDGYSCQIKTVNTVLHAINQSVVHSF